MSVFSPILFKSTDSGAPAMEGTVGALLNVLNACLICNSMFTAVSGASFVDNTVEARLQGGTGFALFQGPTVDVDEAYVGMSSRFGRAKLVFGTPGVQNAAVTLAWEYWNGSAWSALPGVVDGTSELTADGTVTWTIPGDWVAVAVNAVTQFWIRVRFTAGSWTTNPLVATLSVTGWTQAFTGANLADYQQGGGNQFYMSIDDNGPGAGGAKEARIRGYEAMSALATGTGAFPTAVQKTTGLFIRKSVSADGTDRPWYVLADDRTVYVFVATGDGAAGRYFGFMFGDMYSLVPNDSYRTILIARTTENSGVPTSGDPENLSFLSVGIVGATGIVTPATVALGHYMARAYTGVGASVQVAKHGDPHKAQSQVMGAGGQIVLPNPPDGGFYICPLWVCAENATAVLRGRMRGMWQFLHPLATLTDGDVFSGAGALAGKSFVVIKFTAEGAGLYVMETSDTWETN